MLLMPAALAYVSDNVFFSCCTHSLYIALNFGNATFHVGGPLTAGALRPVPQGPHS